MVKENKYAGGVELDNKPLMTRGNNILWLTSTTNEQSAGSITLATKNITIPDNVTKILVITSYRVGISGYMVYNRFVIDGTEHELGSYNAGGNYTDFF